MSTREMMSTKELKNQRAQIEMELETVEKLALGNPNFVSRGYTLADWRGFSDAALYDIDQILEIRSK